MSVNCRVLWDGQEDQQYCYWIVEDSACLWGIERLRLESYCLIDPKSLKILIDWIALLLRCKSDLQKSVSHVVCSAVKLISVFLQYGLRMPIVRLTKVTGKRRTEMRTDKYDRSTSSISRCKAVEGTKFWCMIHYYNSIQPPVRFSSKMLYKSIRFDLICFNSIQFNSIQFNSIQFSSIQFSSIQFKSIQFNSIQFNSIQSNPIQSNSTQFNSVQFNSIQFNPIQSSLIQSSTIQYSAK